MRPRRNCPDRRGDTSVSATFLISIAILLLALGSESSPGTPPRELVLSGYGGLIEEQTMKHIVRPFEKKYNAKVIYDASGVSSQKLAKLKASKGSYTYDVLTLSSYDAFAAGKDGLLEAVDAKKVPSLAKLYDKARTGTGGFGPTYSFDPLILLFNKQKVVPAPDSWEVMWDSKYKGKVAISHVSEGKGLRILIIASWLGGGDEYKIDPGFARIRKLVPNVGPWLTSSEQYQAFYERGEVWLAPFWNGRAQMLKNEGLPVDAIIPKEGTLVTGNAWVVPTDAKNKDLAYKYIDFAIDTAQQEGMAKEAFYSPVNMEVKLPPDIARRVAYGKEQVDKLKLLDEAYLAKQKSAWVERWNKEIRDAARYGKK